MRRDYKYLYQAAPIPYVGATVGYIDPARTAEERRAIARGIARQQAKLRRAKLGERWMVYLLASMLVVAALPVVVVVGFTILARALWRRYTQDCERPRTPVTTDGIHIREDFPCNPGSSDFPLTAMPDLPNLTVGKVCAA